MKEIEVKILDVNREDLERRLNYLGAKKVFDGEIEAIFLDYQDRSIREKGNILRLRKKGKDGILTYKKVIGHGAAKVMEEKEIEISNFKEMETRMKEAGLCQWLKTKKHRVSYKLRGGVRFEFDKHTDQYSYVPEFLEIEAKNVQIIYQCAELLGFKKEDCKAWGLKEAAEHYRQSFIDALKSVSEEKYWKSYKSSIEFILNAVEKGNTGSAKANLTNMMMSLWTHKPDWKEMPLKKGNERYLYENMKNVMKALLS